MVRWMLLLLFGGLLANSELLVAQVEDDRAKILLEKIIKDDPRAERLRAEQELEGLGEAVVFGLMSSSLENPEDEVRAQAMEALEGIVSRHPEWRIPRLVVARIDYSTDREYVTDQLGENADEFLIECLKHDRPMVRRNAVYMLSEAELPTEEMVGIFQRMWNDDDATVRRAAAVELVKLRKQTPEMIQSLVEGLSTQDYNDRIRDALDEVGTLAHRFMADWLIDPMTEFKGRQRVTGHLYGSLFDEDVSPATKPLRTALESKDREIRVRAALGLAALRDDSPAIVEILADEVESAGEMKPDAAIALSKYRPLGARGLKALMFMIRQKDSPWAGSEMSPLHHRPLNRETVAELASMLVDPEWTGEVARVFSRNGAKPPYKQEYVPPLIRLIEDSKYGNADAVKTLFSMGKPAVAELMALLDDPEFLDSTRIGILSKLQDLTHRSGPSLMPIEDELDRIAKLLDDENQELAVAAALLLVNVEYDKRKLGPILLAGFASDSYHMSSDCRRALSRLTWEHETIVPILKEKVENSEGTKREELIYTLNEIAGETPDVVDLVVSHLLSEFDRKSLLNVNRQIKRPAAEKLAELIGDNDLRVRRKAIEALCTSLEYGGGLHGEDWKNVAGSDPPAGVRESLTADDRELRYAATMLLLKYDEQADDALPVLMEMLETEDAVRKALSALQTFGPAAKPALTKLLTILKRSDEEVTQGLRFHVLDVLHAMGPQAAPAVPLLIDLLRDEDLGGSRLLGPDYHVPHVIASIGEAAKPAEPALISMLPEAESLYPIGTALKSIGGSTVELSAEFDRRLSDPTLCYQAMEELPVISEIESLTPRFLKAFKGDDESLKKKAAKLLAWKNFIRDPVLIPHLLDLMKSDSPDVRSVAIEAYGEQRGPVDALIERLREDTNAEVRHAAAAALGDLAASTIESYEQLVYGRNENDVRRILETEAEGYGLGALAAIPALEDLLREPIEEEDEDSHMPHYLRETAIESLAKFRYTAKRSIPLLLELLEVAKADPVQEDGLQDLDKERKRDKRRQALRKAIWSIDPETAIENNLDLPSGRMPW